MTGVNAGQISGGEIEGNSSTVALGAGEVFTGEWADVSLHDSITVAVKTDQDGSFQVQYSPDGANIDSPLTRYYRTSQIEAPHRFTNARRYVRVVYTNGSTAQTYMRLQTMVGPKTPLNAPMDGVVAQDFDATIVRPSEFYDEVTLGRRQGYSQWDKWGYNSDIDTAASEMIWSEGGNMTFLTTAETLDVVSTSAADDDGSTGAHGVVLYGIDANREEIIEVVMLDGTTAVTSTNAFLGLRRMALFRAGSGMVNVGKVTATSSSTSAIQAAIPAGEGSTQQAVFFTQANHTFLARDLEINAVKLSGGGQPVITIKGWVLSFISNAKYEVFRYSMDTQRECGKNFVFKKAFPVGEQSVLYFTGETDTNNTEVSVRFSGIEVRDVDA
jgi:hypothetical protein